MDQNGFIEFSKFIDSKKAELGCLDILKTLYVQMKEVPATTSTPNINIAISLSFLEQQGAANKQDFSFLLKHNLPEVIKKMKGYKDMDIEKYKYEDIIKDLNISLRLYVPDKQKFVSTYIDASDLSRHICEVHILKLGNRHFILYREQDYWTVYKYYMYLTSTIGVPSMLSKISQYITALKEGNMERVFFAKQDMMDTFDLKKEKYKKLSEILDTNTDINLLKIRHIIDNLEVTINGYIKSPNGNCANFKCQKDLFQITYAIMINKKIYCPKCAYFASYQNLLLLKAAKGDDINERDMLFSQCMALELLCSELAQDQKILPQIERYLKNK